VRGSGRRWRFGKPLAVAVALTILSGCSLFAQSRPQLPLGTARGYGQPYERCSPGLLAAPLTQGPFVSQAFDPGDPPSQTAQTESAAPSEMVTYNWHGQEPAGGATNGVTVPPPGAALHTSPGVRLYVSLGGNCIAEWRVSAAQLDGFGGQQESSDSWAELGSGSGQGDAVVVGGVSTGEWIVHIHLAFGPPDSTERDTTDSYALVMTTAGPQPAAVPSPDLVAPCGKSISNVGRAPEMDLSMDGASWTAGKLGVESESDGTTLDELPAPVLAVAAGSLIRVRTADGSCGNDWGGAMFAPVPVALNSVFAGAGLEDNNGSPPEAQTPPAVGGLNAIAPAPGEWLFSVLFFFGNSTVANYYWRLSVR
jgi:hypothetical protein